MIKLIYILGAIGILSCSCNSAQQNNNSTINNTAVASTSNQSKLNGIWGLTNYFDAIIQHKKIADYTFQRPVWFGILIQIKNDSLTSYGTLAQPISKLKYQSDTLSKFDSFYSEWMLINKGDKLILKQFPNQAYKDSTVYIYRKRQDLEFLLKDADDFHKISDNIIPYFNKMLLAGNYKTANEKKTIIFKEDGELIGFDEFNKYKIDNYFGTRHPHKGLDAVTFLSTETRNRKQYNWRFENEILFLREFVRETIIHDGKQVSTDHFVLGKERFKLFKNTK